MFFGGIYVKQFYLDAAATTPLLVCVRDAMLKAMDVFGNPSSVYPLGLAAKDAVEDARHQVALLIGAEDDEIVFTSGATESNNMVIRHLNEAYGGTEMRNGWISAVEHPSVVKAFSRHFESSPVHIYPDEHGVLPRIERDDGWDSGVASVMLANNETGLVHNIDALADAFAVFHTDATQFVPHRQLDVHNFCGLDFIDFASFSAHKFGGPKGVGALFVNRAFSRDLPMPVTPMLGGGGQEHGMRSGTENVIGIVGMGAAAEYTRKHYDEVALRDRIAKFANIILDTIPHCWLNFYPCIPIFSVCVPNVSNASLVMACGAQGVSISSGSACHGNGETPSEVLLNMGLSAEHALNTIRISPPEHMTENEFYAACKIIAEIVNVL